MAPLKKTGTSNRELLLAFIRYGSRPVAFLFIGILVMLWIFPVRVPLFDLIHSIEEVRYGDFVARRAVSAGVGQAFEKLSSLSFDQIQLFLIIGRSRPNDHIKYEGPEVTESNLKSLKQIGLLSYVQITKDPETSILNYEWTISKEGTKLHELLMKEVIVAIQKSSKA